MTVLVIGFLPGAAASWQVEQHKLIILRQRLHLSRPGGLIRPEAMTENKRPITEASPGNIQEVRDLLVHLDTPP